MAPELCPFFKILYIRIKKVCVSTPLTVMKDATHDPYAMQIYMRYQSNAVVFLKML